MDDARAKGFQVFRELMPGVLSDEDVIGSEDAFGAELLDIGIESVFGRLWSREGLSLRDRSLVTLGILIAQRSTDELHHHVRIARTNGLSEDEIAEVIYHSSGYAGFPAASTACTVAREALSE